MHEMKDIAIEVLQRCNSNCIFCSSISEADSSNIISFDKFVECVSFARYHEVEEFSISGGEPLIHPRIHDMVKCALSFGLSNVRLYTSGNYSTDLMYGFMENVVQQQQFLYSDLNSRLRVVFNYPSYDHEVFKKLTGCTDEQYNDINANLSISSACIQTEAHIVPNKINLSTLFNTCGYLQFKGIKKIKFLNLVCQGRAQDNKDILELEDYAEFDHIIGKIREYYSEGTAKINLEVNIPQSKYNERHECKAGHSKLIIKYDGNAYPCEALKCDDRNIIGNINTNSIDEIWSNGIRFRNNNTGNLC